MKEKLLTEIFRTQKSVVYQSDTEKCFYVDFRGSFTAFSVQNFFSFKKQIDKIELTKLIESTVTGSEIEILFPRGTERCFVLTIDEILDLKEVLSGAKVMLELNSIIRKANYSTPA